jgi:hypothetical protein
MAEDDQDDRIAALYALPLGEFVAARNALGKELKDAGVKKLPKPSATAWALNQLARQAPEELDALLAAGRTVAEAQAGAVRGKGSAPFREAVAAERAALAPLLARARQLVRAEPQVQQVADALRAAAADPAVGAQLRDGRLSEAPEPGGFGAFDGMELSGAGGAGGDDADDEAALEAEAEARAARERRQLEQAAEDAERDAARLEARALEAEQRAATLRSEADGARRRADDAAARL